MFSFLKTLNLQEFNGKKRKRLTVVKVCQLSFLGPFAKTPVSGPREKHPFLPISRIISSVLIYRSTRFALFVLLYDTNKNKEEHKLVKTYRSTQIIRKNSSCNPITVHKSANAQDSC